MPKFFVDPSNITESDIIICGEDVNHLIKVLRLSKNDIIIVCDGQGYDYKVVLEQIGKKEIMASILEKWKSSSEPSVQVVLFQGIPKSSKMEYIIQKTTELGITQIVPVMTKRTVVKIDDKKSEINKLERWRKVALEAAKQSNRGKVPYIAQPITFDHAIEQIKMVDFQIMPYEKEMSCKLKDLLVSDKEIKTAGIFIGPEGGFDDDEVEAARKSGISTVTLGPRILRTETAGSAVLAILMYEFEG